MKPVRRADGGHDQHRTRWSTWKAFWRRLKRFRRRSLSLSELLAPPSLDAHPFSSWLGREQCWYVLLVPTYDEGLDVAEYLPLLLSRQMADFTIIVAHYDDDPSAVHVRRAADANPRIVPLSVARVANPGRVMETKLREAFRSLEQSRGRAATDAMLVPLSRLIVRINDETRF